MKKFCIRAAAVLLMLTLLSGLCFSAFASSEVSYAGQAAKFIFSPGSRHSVTDLFADFKGVMPGDRLTQTITVRNDILNNCKVKLYMRSLGAVDGSEAFLRQINLTVTPEGSSRLYAAPADQAGDLGDWVYLGTVYSGGKINLQLSLDVPITMGNEFQNAIGFIDWEFSAEELEIEPDDPRPPVTGDELLTFAVVGGCALLGLLLVPIIRRSRKKKTQK